MNITLIEAIEVLQKKLDWLDSADLQSQETLVYLIEATYWARSILEVFDDFKFEEYGYPLKSSIPTRPFVSYEAETTGKSICLKELLNTIIHFRYFYFNYSAGNKYPLQVQSDWKREPRKVCYSEFIKALESLVVPKELAVLFMLDRLENNIDKIGRIDDPKYPLDAHNDLGWLLGDNEVELKQKIMEEFFGIANVSTDHLRDLRFGFAINKDIKLQIIYMEDGTSPGIQSEFFEPKLLLNLAREFYKQQLEKSYEQQQA